MIVGVILEVTWIHRIPVQTVLHHGMGWPQSHFKPDRAGSDGSRAGNLTEPDRAGISRESGPHHLNLRGGGWKATSKPDRAGSYGIPSGNLTEPRDGISRESGPHHVNLRRRWPQSHFKPDRAGSHGSRAGDLTEPDLCWISRGRELQHSRKRQHPLCG
jgi:hypothetical protein